MKNNQKSHNIGFSKAAIIGLFVLLVLGLVVVCYTSQAFAEDLDSLNQEQIAEDQAETKEDGLITDDVKGIEDDEGASAIADYLKRKPAVTSEDMAKGSKLAAPAVKIIGNVIGVLMVLIMSLIGLVTVLDLAYIALPFMRSILNSGEVSSGGIGGMNMMGLAGGMAQPPMMPQSQPPQKKWVSDEAVAALKESQPQDSGGMMGGMPGMMGQPQPPQKSGGKSAILLYFKKRTFFIIMFAVASVLLMSSIFTDTGLNIAEMLYKLWNKIVGSIG